MSFLRFLAVPFAAVLCAIATHPAAAQVKINLTLNHKVYVQFEPVVAKADLNCRFGRMVVLNGEGDNPTFHLTVRDEYGHELARLPDAPRYEPLLSNGDAQITVTNNLLRSYPMAQPGYYSVEARVEWMGRNFRSEKTHIEIVPGREVTRITGSVPADDSQRTWRVLHVNRGQQDHLLLRIDDEAASLCFGVYALGRSVINEQPELALDASGNLHVLFQTAPRIFRHSVFTPFGVMIDDQKFGQDFKLVRLKGQPDGSVKAEGSPEDRKSPPMMRSIIEDR
jgi:hypothetical protein